MNLFLILGLVPILFSSCVTSSENFEEVGNDGTYTGSAVAYITPDNPDITRRICPNIDVSLTADNGSIEMSVTDTYDGFTPDPGLEVFHQARTTTFDNSRFELTAQWDATTDTLISDLQALGTCGADSNMGTLGTIQNVALRIDEELGIVGQVGLGRARGSIFYGLECADNVFMPVCVYYMELDQQ